jgi:subtilase family serine protease
MRRPSSVVAATALAATTIAVAAGGSAAHAAAATSANLTSSATATLPGSAAPFAAKNRAISAVPANNRLTIQVWLKPQTAAAESYAAAVSTPGNPLFEHYLTPDAYTARFGATAAEATSVTSWLTSAGFTGISADLGRDYVQATAAVSTINTAMKIQLRYYGAGGGVSAGKYLLRGNAQPVSLPGSVAGSVVGVTGLDNAAPQSTFVKPGNPAAKTGATPAASKKAISFACSSWYLQHYVVNRLPEKYGTTKFPTVICGYSADQLRAAYGYNRHNIGKGVTIALVEIGLAPDMFETLQDYTKVNRIESPSASRYAELSLGKGSACGDPFDIEEQLDVESSYDLAPLAKQLVVGGDSCNNGFFGLQALFDADTAILDGNGNHPLAQIASNSWEGGDESIPVNQLNIEHAYLLRAAAEGVSMLFSAGDSSGVETPSSDPYATAVGGTTLGIGHHDPRLFETGWSTGISSDVNNKWIFQGEQSAGGGGASLLWAQPSYQRGVVPDSLATAPGNRGGLVRAVPDISAVGDPFTGMAVGLLTFNNAGAVTGYMQEPIGGTSLASPLVAGLVADAEQYQHPFGFLNPALYKLVGTDGLHDPTPITSETPSRYHGVACDAAMCGVPSLTTFDDQNWSMLGYTGQVTRKGYDTMTGVGTPNGQSFVYDLRAIYGAAS